MTHRPKSISTPKTEPRTSIFSPSFLDLLEQRSVDGHCEHESGFSGPWRVEAIGDGYAVVRDGDEQPRGVFKHRETACLVAAVLPAVGSDSLYAVNGFNNQELRALLAEDARYADKTEKQRSGMTTRSLRLLREHGVIRRLPKSRRYQLTSKGRGFVTSLQAALAASTEELTKMAA